MAAVQQENVTYLTKFPGIGKKTAQRIIIDLKDKLKGFTPSIFAAAALAPGSPEVPGRISLEEAVDALLALGYSEGEIQQIRGQLAEKAQAGTTTEQLVKQGLSLLLRG